MFRFCHWSPIKPAMDMATGASSRPITATIAPIAAGGKRMSIHLIPTYLTIRLKMTKERPKTMKAPLAASKPKPAAKTEETGAIKAKEEPK